VAIEPCFVSALNLLQLPDQDPLTFNAHSCQTIGRASNSPKDVDQHVIELGNVNHLVVAACLVEFPLIEVQFGVSELQIVDPLLSLHRLRVKANSV
jgi:hypothetical protein